jgi:hypothetical protein
MAGGTGGGIGSHPEAIPPKCRNSPTRRFAAQRRRKSHGSCSMAAACSCCSNRMAPACGSSSTESAAERNCSGHRRCQFHHRHPRHSHSGHGSGRSGYSGFPNFSQYWTFSPFRLCTNLSCCVNHEGELWSNSMKWKSPNIPTNPNCDPAVVAPMAAHRPWGYVGGPIG